jgi:hypothetical protein
LKESHTQTNVNLRWETSIKKRALVYFTLPGALDELRIMHGDEIRLRGRVDAQTEWAREGNVVKVPNNVSYVSISLVKSLLHASLVSPVKYQLYDCLDTLAV